MAQIANTLETFDGVGIREELADRIWELTPDETPFLRLIGRKDVKTTRYDWQIDTLEAIDVDNNQPEGNDWTYDSVAQPTRVANHAQISEKSLVISATMDQTDKAGRKSELAYQVGKKGRALRCDMEAIALSNQAASAGTGDAATNRKLGGFRAWLTSNDSLGGGGGASGSISSNLPTAATNGTQRALTKALIDDVVLSTRNSGGKANVCMLSTYNKTVVSRFLDDADLVPNRKAANGDSAVTVIGAVDMYVTDFGNLNFVPNDQMTRAGATIARNVFIIDPKMVKLGVFRDIQIHTPAKTGDAEKRVLNCEYTLIVNNEAAHGVVADTYGLTAST